MDGRLNSANQHRLASRFTHSKFLLRNSPSMVYKREENRHRNYVIISTIKVMAMNLEKVCGCLAVLQHFWSCLASFHLKAKVVIGNYRLLSDEKPTIILTWLRINLQSSWSCECHCVKCQSFIELARAPICMFPSQRNCVFQIWNGAEPKKELYMSQKVITRCT